MSIFQSSRRRIAFTSVVAACLGLSGCGLFSSSQPSSAAAPIPTAPVVESSVNSQGMPIAQPAYADPAQQAYAAGANQYPAGTAAPAAPYAPPSGAPAAAPSVDGLHLQAGTFSSQQSAEGIATSIRNKTPQFANLVHVAPRGHNWRVLIGPFPSQDERHRAADTIRTAIGSEVVNAAP